MAEFVQTMKDWRRMCQTIDSCDKCKFHTEGNDCMAVYEGEMDYAKAEKVITTWAAEHPEPEYPTLAEWLRSIGLANHRMIDPIPADIAQKLGIEPKK